MKKFSLLLVLPLVLAACATSKKGSNLPGVALGPPQKAAVLTDHDRNAFVPLVEGGTVSVNLQSNQRAGYHWRLARPLDAKVVTLASAGSPALPPVALPPVNEPAVAPGTEEWVFKAVGPGTTSVRLVYARPNQPLDAAVDYTFQVNVE